MLSPYTALASNLLFPLHERLKRHSTVAVRRRLEQTQWWAPEPLQALRIERLRALLHTANDGVPYYTGLFRQLGFEPDAVRSLADLQALPLLTKAIIRAQGDALKHRNAQGLARCNTGGSSGEPLVFFIGRERVSHDVAAKWRATRWWGVDIGDRETVLWGSPIELGAQDRVRRWRDALLRSQLLPAFEMGEDRLDGFLAAIRRQRPKMLFGYPSALGLLARHAERRGVAMNNLGIRVAFVTSERLYDDQRERISRVFGCPVANGYGSRDAGFIAHECPQGSLHITAEDVIVELVDAAGAPVAAGEPGEIVVTHLATGEFPFIRYRTGDVATLSDKRCGCGRGLPVLADVQGRTTDFVHAADGSVMHGLALIYILRDRSGIESFKVVQESRLRTRVFIVTAPGFDRGSAVDIAAQFRQRLGAAVDVGIEFVDAIAPEKSGKHRYIVSHVAAAAPEEPSHA